MVKAISMSPDPALLGTYGEGNTFHYGVCEHACVSLGLKIIVIGS